MSESHAATHTTSFQASDGSLPDSCFAYVPDPAKPSTRKLKLCGPDGKRSKTVIAAAKAALGPSGYRGNRVQLPSSARAGVVAKVNAAAKSVGLDPISASEFDPAAFDEPSASDAHVDVPIGALNRMRSRLKGKLRHGRAITNDDVDEAHKYAKRTALLPVDNTGATAQMSEAVQMCDGGDVWPKLAKADPAVGYRMASADNPTDDGDGDIDACGSCRFFQWGRCQLVEGTIEADHVCSLFKDQPVTFVSDDDLAELDDGDEMAAQGYAEPPLRFAESLKFPNLPATDLMQFLPQIKPFSEPPEWLNYLPGPGTYTHASYGKVPMPADRIANFVTQFNAGVYQKNLPIDAEHQTKLSGATGYIKEMRVASDGSAEARIEWTDRGKKLLASDRFKYFSPEWFDQWTDPVDEKVYRDIAIGGALTTRPFFKERALKPLAASELGAVEWIDESEAVTTTANETPSTRQGAKTMAEAENITAVAGTIAPIGMTEEQIKRFNDLETSFKAAETARLAAEGVAKQANERAKKLELDGRTKKFTDEVRGKSDASGAVWRFAEPAEFVQHLEDLTQAFGEESPQVAFFTKVMRTSSSAFSEITHDSTLFKVFGGDFPAADASANPYEALMAQARAYAEAHPEFTPERAFSEIVINDAKNKDLVSKL